MSIPETQLTEDHMTLLSGESNPSPLLIPSVSC